MMGILSRILGKRHVDSNALVGCWHLIPPPEGEPFEPAEAEFLEDGRLFYSVLSGTRWQIMKLLYRVEGDVVVSNQLSAPGEERSKFRLEPDGTLTLNFGGDESRFRRGPKLAPKV